jgi:glycosyltransferase involved in cell wall biosynthesis
MRLLFCTLDYPPSVVGGAENQAKLQAEELVKRGHLVDVVCARAPGYRSETINGVRVHRLPRLQVHRLRTISYMAVLAAFLLLRLRRFDLVHVHLANVQADVAVAIARLLRRPSYVKLAAGGPLGEIGRLSVIAPITRYYGLRKATQIQAISKEILSDLRAIGVPSDRIRRIPNGVELSPEPTAPGDRAEARRRLLFPLDGVIVLFAGRFEKDKGVQDLIAVWRDERLFDAQLLVVGSPGIKDPVTMDNLPPGVVSRPWSREISLYLAAADVFVLPSYVEGMSNALLEAMAAGIPPVATLVGAAPEMIQDGANGLLIQPGDLAGLKLALSTLVTDGGARSRIGAAARASVIERYGIETVVSEIEAAYRSIVAVS